MSRKVLVDPRAMARAMAREKHLLRIWAHFGIIVIRVTKEPRLEVRVREDLGER